MMKILLIFTSSWFCFMQNIYSQEGVTITVTETTLNNLLDVANVSELLGYSVWERGDFEKRLDYCNGREGFEEQMFYSLSLPNTISLDVQNSNRFSLSSTLKYTNGEDIFLQGYGSVKSPISQLGGDHLLEMNVTAYGSINGYFSFENNKLKLVFDNVSLISVIQADGGQHCNAGWSVPLFNIDTLEEMEVNIGSSILPESLKGYFTSNSPIISTSSNELTVTYKTIPFMETELDDTYSTNAAYEVSLNGKTVPSNANNSNVTAGSVIILKNFTVEHGATFSAKIQPRNFGTEVID